MPLVGTAGHVDHGKSTLVLALSGRDPDRWAEEKRRGLTIDLGFAWADLGTGQEISFVDVPGHERYLKNMLAGIEAIDIALLVVAAEEGWMPQSEEHLAVLDLLEVKRGVVALTKSDLVDEETLELATLEIREKLEGTSLESATVVPVSAPSGIGLDDLRSELLRLAGMVEVPHRSPRLWIDRSFSVAGAGTVVTGSLLEGALAVGDVVEIYPTGREAKIRTLQSHERPVESARPGSRVAVGLAGVGRHETLRGHMLGMPGAWRTTNRFTATLHRARYVDEIAERGAYQIHVGSGAHPMTIQKSGDGVAVLATRSSLPLRMGDRFIVRDSGRRLVVGGGQVLDPAPGALAVALDQAASLDPNAEPDVQAGKLLDLRTTDRVANLSRDTGGGYPEGALVIGDLAMTPATMQDLTAKAHELVAGAHQKSPLRAGLPLATLATTLGIDRAVAEIVVQQSGDLRLTGPDVSLGSHQPVLDVGSTAAWDAARLALESSLAVPNVGDLGLADDVVHWLLRQGRLVRISDSLVYLPEQIDEITERMAKLSDQFSVGEVKEELGLSRKYVVPILEWLDANLITVRKGEKRSLRRVGGS